MRRSLIVVSAVLLVFVAAWGGGVLSSPEPQEGNQPSIPPEARENAKLRGVSALADTGMPLHGVYGGSYWDEETATLHIWLTRITDEYKAIVKQVEGRNVEFRQARFSMLEQSDLGAQVTRLAGRVPLVLTYWDIRNDRLIVGLRKIRPEYVAAIREVVGDEVPIKFVEGELETPLLRIRLFP